MQPGERQLHLRLDARGPHHLAARRIPGQVVQQRRLAHTRLAGYHQRPALTRPDSINQAVQHLAFEAPAPQLWSGPSDGEMCRHLTGTDGTRPHWPRRLAAGQEDDDLGAAAAG